MVTLTIFEADGSRYWEPCYFNSMAEAEAWYANECRKPYWKPGRVAQYVDNSPPPEEVAKRKDDEKKAREKHEQTRDALSKIGKKDLSTVEGCAAAIEKILSYMEILK